MRKLFSIRQGADPRSEAIVKDDLKAKSSPARRLFMKRGLTLGALSMLTGCAITDDDSVQTALNAVSRFNDRVQPAIFHPNQLAPTYPDSMITRPFTFNAFYEEDEVREFDGSTFKLEVGGMVEKKSSWTLGQLNALPHVSQVTRHIWVEGWSAICKWGGVPFAEFLKRVGADATARYVGFKCADDYHTSIDMATALHAQTQLTLTYDGATLPAKYGCPIKLRMPTKLGYKNPKHIQAIYVTNTYPGSHWKDEGYNWFGGS